MKKLKTFFAAILMMTFAMNAVAQEGEYRPTPYWFVGVQGGVQNTLNKDFNNKKTFTPTAALSVGHFFSPEVGARLNFNGIWNKGTAASLLGEGNSHWNYNYLTTSADVLVNLCTVFGNKDYYPVNVYLIGGLGLYHAWNNDEAADLEAKAYRLYDTENDKRNAFNGRIGLQFEVNLCRNVAFNLEGTYNMHAGDNKTFAKDNRQVVLLAGLNFKFGYKKKVVEVVEEEVLPEPVPEPVYATRIDTTWYDDTEYVEVTRDRDIKKEIFYGLAKSDVDANMEQITAVAEFLKNVKDAEITITGYADKGTGNAKLNMNYSKMRAEQTKKALVKAGVDPKVIKVVEWKGDTVQPYADNDKNRLAVITGHGVYTDKDPKTVKKFRTKEVRYRVK